MAIPPIAGAATVTISAGRLYRDPRCGAAESGHASNATCCGAGAATASDFAAAGLGARRAHRTAARISECLGYALTSDIPHCRTGASQRHQLRASFSTTSGAHIAVALGTPPIHPYPPMRSATVHPGQGTPIKPTISAISVTPVTPVTPVIPANPATLHCFALNSASRLAVDAIVR